MGRPNPVTITLGSWDFKVFAEVFIINRRLYQTLNSRLELINKEINLQTTNGSVFKMEGQGNQQVKINQQFSLHSFFFVVKNFNRNIKLGNNWLKQNRDSIYLDLGALRINDEYVALEDRHIPSIVRLDRPVVLKAQYMYMCMKKIWIMRGYGDTYQKEQLV